MKILTILLSVGILSINTTCHGQTWAEWFKQKATQKKYLIEQIIALKVHLDYVREGYDIAKKGLTTISNIKDGDFNLHRDFFGSLEGVNPAIKNYAKVADILHLQSRILEIYHNTYGKVKASGRFSTEEIDYIYRVYGRLLKNCSHTVDALVTVTTAGELTMKDDERLQQIDRLYEDMQDQFTFCQSFSQKTLVLAISRMNEENEVQKSRALYGIQN